MFRILHVIPGGVLALAVAAGAAAQHPHTNPAPAPAAPAAAATARLFDGLGTYHRPIKTSSPEAQKYFDQGLTLVYGFNHDEAIRSFQQAAALDPRAPMPLWGIALSLGENINSPIDPERQQKAYAALKQAEALAANGSPVEQAYVQALSTRYSQDPKADPKPLAEAYATAMKALSSRYPDDLDAQTLYAESLMNLHPWKLWTIKGEPLNDDTLVIVATLEGVLARAPLHPGANHYYIHAVEASKTPERALASAARLESLVPSAGHLVHMPAHIYMRTGDYQAAATRNAVAAGVDEKYIAETGAGGLYPLMYYTHNLQFRSAAAAMAGRYADALESAQATARHIEPVVKDIPMVEAFTLEPLLVQVRFAKWDEVLAVPAPPADRLIATAAWHYARASAFAGKQNVAKAEEERAALREVAARVPADGMVGQNTAPAVLEVAQLVADGRVAQARGDRAGAIDAFTRAVAKQDTLLYDEPPDFHYPVRESLGAALLAAGRASDAETVFRTDLTYNRRNGRALFGLWKSLEAQGRTTEAQLVKDQYEAAWRDADVTLTAGSW
jgi:tetratricopeptide (TPR) repeat protein